jgi:hypothetical protein
MRKLLRITFDPLAPEQHLESDAPARPFRRSESGADLSRRKLPTAMLNRIPVAARWSANNANIESRHERHQTVAPVAAIRRAVGSHAPRTVTESDPMNHGTNGTCVSVVVGYVSVRVSWCGSVRVRVRVRVGCMHRCTCQRSCVCVGKFGIVCARVLVCPGSVRDTCVCVCARACVVSRDARGHCRRRRCRRRQSRHGRAVSGSGRRDPAGRGRSRPP